MARIEAVNFSQKFRSATEQVGDLSGLVCWEDLRGLACECGGDLCHFPPNTCGSDLNRTLGGTRRGCGFGDRCSKVHLEETEAMRLICPFLASTAPSSPSTAVLSRSKNPPSTSAKAKKCTVPPQVVLDRIKKYVDKSPYIERFLQSPFLDEWLADNDLRLLLSNTKNRAKEICEAFAAADRVLDILGQGRESCSTVFDVCSGKGFTGEIWRGVNGSIAE